MKKISKVSISIDHITLSSDDRSMITLDSTILKKYKYGGRKQSRDTTGNSYRYIGRYAEKIKLTPQAACLKVMSETEKVLNLILKPKGVE